MEPCEGLEAFAGDGAWPSCATSLAEADPTAEADVNGEIWKPPEGTFSDTNSVELALKTPP